MTDNKLADALRECVSFFNDHRFRTGTKSEREIWWKLHCEFSEALAEHDAAKDAQDDGLEKWERLSMETLADALEKRGDDLSSDSATWIRKRLEEGKTVHLRPAPVQPNPKGSDAFLGEMIANRAVLNGVVVPPANGDSNEHVALLQELLGAYGDSGFSEERAALQAAIVALQQKVGPDDGKRFGWSPEFQEKAARKRLAMLLCGKVDDVNAGEATFLFEGLTDNGNELGDWSVTVRKHATGSEGEGK